MSEFGDLAESYHRQSRLDELRAQAFPVVMVGILLSTWVAILSVFPKVPETTLLWPIGLGIVSLLSYRLLGTSVSAGSAIFVCGVVIAALAVAFSYPHALTAFLLAPVVLVASLLLGPLAGFAVAVTSSLALLAAEVWGGVEFPPSSETMVLVLIWATALLAWLAARPVYIALDWAWHSYTQALEMIQELRERQGELNRTLKNLNDAYSRLEQVNAELARARAAAQEARQLKTEFAANISHELRTPLNLIIGFSEMMATDPDSYGVDTLPPAYQRDVDAIYRNAQHLSNLINDILDLSQVDAHRMGLSRETVRLDGIVDEAVEIVRALFESKGLTLSAAIPTDLPALFVDRTRIRQVLVNLLSNAVRFTDQGAVRITARLVDSQAVVAVADTGPGIAAEDLPRVFEAFRQVDGSTRRSHGGSGLGLTISKRFVELHGGNMWVETVLGEGSTFYFSLPLQENVVSVPLRREWETWVRPGVGQAAAENTLVVVDPEPDAASLFRRYLENWRVVAASDIAELRGIAETTSFGAVAFTSPSDTCRAQVDLDGLLPDVAVLTCPMRGRRDVREALGVVEYLVKPIRCEQITAIARRFPWLRDVAIVDDDPEMVRLLRSMVRAVAPSARVRSLYGGAEALAAMTQARPDLVLLDLLMPSTSGYTVLERMRLDDQLREVPVVVVTAGDEHPLIIAAEALTVTRRAGLSIADLMSCVRATLSALAVSSASRS